MYIRDSKAKAQVPAESEAFQVQAKCIKNDSQQERSWRLQTTKQCTSTNEHMWSLHSGLDSAQSNRTSCENLKVAPNGAEARCSFKDQPGFREKRHLASSAHVWAGECINISKRAESVGAQYQREVETTELRGGCFFSPPEKGPDE